MPLARRPSASRTWLPAAFAALLIAGSAAAAPAPAADPRAAIAKRLEVPPGAVRPSVLPGIYEVARGAEVLYVTADGRYALSGDLYETGSGRNLTEHRRIEGRRAALHAVPDSDAIIFAPPNPRYTVTVFTDVDCAYCRKLHSQIAEYNRLGIRIRYLSYPRTGPGTDSWHKAEVVWCAADRQDALTRAKQGIEVAGKSCEGNPVKRTFELGEELGIRGTPGIFTEAGEYLPGYYTPERLAKRLQELETPPSRG
jgi:thiol:disulfide interchange protein DsbC